MAKKVSSQLKMRHECATKFLFDFINIVKRYKKNPANHSICRVFRSFWPFFKNFENLIFSLFSGLRGERGIRTVNPRPPLYTAILNIYARFKIYCATILPRNLKHQLITMTICFKSVLYFYCEIKFIYFF